MIGLIGKELRAVAPYYLAVIVLITLSIAEKLFATGIDKPLSVALESNLGGWLTLGGPICFAVGVYGLSSEFTDSTIELLDALPIHRFHVHVAKTIAGLSVAVVVVAAAVAECVALNAMVTAPAAPPFSEALLVQVGLLSAGLVAFLATGMALAWAGELSWLPLLLIAMGLEVFAHVTPSLRALAATTYLEIAYEGSTPAPVAWAPRLWLFCAAVGLAGSTFWMVRARGAFGTSTAEKFYRVLIFVFGAVLVLAALGTAVLNGDDVGALSAAEVKIERVDNFTILADANADTEALRARLPEVDAAVRAILDIDRPLPLDVEWMGVGSFHAGEQWGRKVRISPDTQDRDVLPHEIAHAYFTSLVGEGGTANRAAWGFFNEGLATWVAARVEASNALAEMEATAGRLRALQQDAFDLLVRPDARKKRFDPHQIYPLGVVFVQALVAEGGEAAPGCLLRQMAPLDEELDPNVFWFAITRACGVRLDRVVARYDARLNELAPEVAPELPVGRLVTNALGRPSVEFDYGVVGALCRFRTSDDATDADLFEAPAHAGRSCGVPKRMDGPRGVWVQLGVRLQDGTKVFGEWAELPKPQASCRDLACATPFIRRWADLPAASEAPPRVELQLVHWIASQALAFTSDGALLVSGSHDRTVRIWDAASLRLARRIDAGFAVDHVEVSPDDRFVLASGADHAGLWRLRDGLRLWRRSLPRKTQVSLSAHDALVLAHGPTGLSVLDAGTGQVLADLDVERHDGLAWSRFGATPSEILTVRSDGVVQILDVDRGTSQVRHELGFEIETAAIALGAERAVVTGTSTGALIDLRSGATYASEVSQHGFDEGAIDRAGERVAFAVSRGSAVVTGPGGRRALACRSAHAVALDPSGERLGIDCIGLRIEDLGGGGTRRIDGLSVGPRTVDAIASGDVVVRYGIHGVGVVDPATCALRSSYMPERSAVLDVALDGRGATGVVRTPSGLAHLSFLDPTRLSAKRASFAVPERAKDIVFLPSGVLAYVEKDDVVVRERKPLRYAVSGQARSLAVLGTDLFIGTRSQEVLRMTPGGAIAPFASDVWAFDLVADEATNRLVALGVEDVTMLDVATSTVVWRRKARAHVDDAAFGESDGIRWVAVGTKAGISLYRASDGRPLRHISTSAVMSIAAPQGPHLVAAHEDGALRVWDARDGTRVCGAAADRRARTVRWDEDSYVGDPATLRAYLHEVRGGTVSMDAPSVAACAATGRCPRRSAAH